jgi:hypothetical protein
VEHYGFTVTFAGTLLEQLADKTRSTKMPTMTPAANAALKTYQDKVRAQIQEGKTKLEQLATKAKEHGAQAELNAINTLKSTRENIDRKLQDLQTTHDNNMAHAKAAIDTDVVAFNARIVQLSAKLKTEPAKK